jgi:hypothetical protein
MYTLDECITNEDTLKINKVTFHPEKQVKSVKEKEVLKY